MRILVLGGYGLIGLSVSRQLLKAGHDIIGLARSRRKGMALLPEADWIEADLRDLDSAAQWTPHLAGVDAVVNAAGALQNGLKDDVARVQESAILSLVNACETAGVRKLIQISAPGASASSDTRFYATKGAADDGIKASTLDWTILRPGLVLSPHAYGGTSLLRMLAAFPCVQPLVMGEARIQTVAADDVAHAVVRTLEGGLERQDFDLLSDDTHTLEALILKVRKWQGFAAPHAIIRLPQWVGGLTARLADIAGWLGWRSALRTTALTVLTSNIMGNGARWRDATDMSLKSLNETLKEMPSTVQERVYARAMLVFPLLVVLLSGFWIASGVIGLIQHDAAIQVLNSRLNDTLASICVRGGALVDIAIGCAIVFRPATRKACLASIIVSCGYLAGGALLAPALWADPLGPMVKVFTAIGLALAVSALAEDR